MRGTVTLVSGDNLGSDFIGGYKQLSSAHRKFLYGCRYLYWRTRECKAISTCTVYVHASEIYLPYYFIASTNVCVKHVHVSVHTGTTV